MAPATKAKQVSSTQDAYVRTCTIFLSYNHSTTKLADDIQQKLEKDGYTVIRDLQVKYKGNFKEFMKQIRETDYALLLINDNYLESINCMFEITELLKEANYEDKYLPIVIEGTKLYSAQDINYYLKYWVDRKKKLDDDIKGLPSESLGSSVEDAKRITRILPDLDDFLNKLRDINHIELPLQDEQLPEAIGEKDYKDISDHLKERKIVPNLQLKILSITASPRNGSIFYEKEQDTLLDTFRNFKKEQLYFDIPDPVEATIIEMRKYLIEGKHDVLMITAHGGIDKEGRGYLAFEDARGKGEGSEITGKELAEELTSLKERENVNIQLVILSSCHSARKESIFLPVTQELHKAGIPAVIGMSTSITHDAAIHFNQAFFTEFLREESTITKAFEAGKAGIASFEEEKRRNYPGLSFASEIEIPQLFLNNPDLSIHDISTTTIEAPKRPESHTFDTNYLERGFVGRRNTIREILNKVNNHDPAIVLKGPGGIGKSTLTSRVMTTLLRNGYDYIEFQGKIEPAAIIEKVVRKAEDKGYKGIEERILGCPTPSEKIRGLTELFLTKEKLVFIFDNFEDNQDEKTKTYINPELDTLMRGLRKCLEYKDSFLIISTRYELPGFKSDTIEVKEFTPLETNKKLYYTEALSQLDESGKHKLFYSVGKNPRSMDLLNQLLLEEYGKESLTWNQVADLLPDLKEIIETGKSPDIDFSPFLLPRLLKHLNSRQLQLLKVVATYRLPVEEEAISHFYDSSFRVNRQDRIYLESLSLLEYSRGVGQRKSYYYVHRLTATYLFKSLEEKEKINLHRKAAQYWDSRTKRIQSIEDYLESREHYLLCHEYGKAAEIALNTEGLLRRWGDMATALRLNLETLHSKVSQRSKSSALGNISNIYYSQGKMDKAIGHINQALEIDRKLGYKQGVASDLGNITKL